MLDRARKSLALRLALLYALLFTVGSAALFAVLYWRLAQALEEREQAAVTQRAEDFAHAYDFGGSAALRARLAAEDQSPEVRSFFVRVMGPDGETTFARVPSNWVDSQTQQVLVPDGWGGWQPQVMQTVRVPVDAQKDFAIASRHLADGNLLQVARSTDSRTILLSPLRRTFGTVGLAVFFLAAGSGAVIAWRSTQPLRSVNETVAKIIATGDFSARVPSQKGGDELSQLSRQFNLLLDKNAGLIRALRETHDNLAHDLRTPLARLRGAAEFALQRPDSDTSATREALADCVEEAEKIQKLLEALLDVSAAENGTLALHLEKVDLSAIARDAANLYLEVAEEKKILITVTAEAGLFINGDAVRLRQATANLLDNALKYSPVGGSVTLVTKREGITAILEVSDSGPGIPFAEREKIWERLYRGDASRSQRGLGLGLSLVKAIVEAHRGTVSVAPVEPTHGSVFKIALPV